MSIAAIQLKKVSLLHLLVDVNEKYKDASEKEDYDITASFDFYSDDKDLRFKIVMPYKIVARNKKNCAFKKLEIKLEGYFELDEGTPEEMVKQMIPFNCLFMLYGVMRGIVINATASAPGGPMMLPAINFGDVIDEHIEKQKSMCSQQLKEGDKSKEAS